MPKKRFSAEQIVTLLRQIEVSIAQGKSAPLACRDAGISLLRDELLNGEIFYSLKEAKIVIEQWRKALQHNQTALIARISTACATDDEPVPDTARSGRANAIISPSRWYKKSVRPARYLPFLPNLETS